MKIVKESINEIRQDQSTSGLGAIGLGSRNICKAYHVFQSFWPNALYKLDKLNPNLSGYLLDAMEEAAKIFQVNSDEVAYINTINTKTIKGFKDYFEKLVEEDFITRKYTAIQPDVATITLTTSPTNGIMKIKKRWGIKGEIGITTIFVFKLPNANKVI
jgi:hypothetical protein